MHKRIAHFISIITQPLLMPTAVAFFFIQLAGKNIQGLYMPVSVFMGLLFFTTCLVPVISIFIMWRSGLVSSLSMGSLQERPLAFSIISVFYVIATYFFYYKTQVAVGTVFTLAVITICILLLTSISFFWKISAHMTGISGLIGIVLATAGNEKVESVLPLVATLFVLAGLTGTARLSLRAHSPAQVLAGFVLGFGVCYAAFYYFGSWI